MPTIQTVDADPPVRVQIRLRPGKWRAAWRMKPVTVASEGAKVTGKSTTLQKIAEHSNTCHPTADDKSAWWLGSRKYPTQISPRISGGASLSARVRDSNQTEP